ncbi:MAG: phospho-N-acetylmuramoyl-pentapeptide-transferase [Holosporales bacterium]|jgi:phospho-N-acetylmuramoyl-pentapeptide-transferase|nr:phospho-N-acetylmuramoyl-pentapeptide-transferase [Holosporales bacterium]
MFYSVFYKLLGANSSLVNIFKYVTFRSIGAFITSFLLILIFGKRFIRILRVQQKRGQPIRIDGPQSHIETKKGTPTLGGLMIIFSVFIGSVFWGDWANINLWMSITVLIGFGAIGAIDDYFKIKRYDYHGLRGKKKFILQAIIALLCCYISMKIHPFSGATKIFFPILKNCQIEIGPFFLIWAVFVIVGSSNAVNLTDGLDGLAMGSVIMSSICFAVISYLVGNKIFADYLQILYIPGMSEVCVFLSSMVGASLGFMWFNAPPAKIFMGDTGSVAIGGSLGFVALLSKHEIVFALIGGVFVIETISVVLQVGYYKLTGRRIFLMAPIHHHFEKKGWAESTIVFRFWIVSIVLGILGLATLKVR